MFEICLNLIKEIPNNDLNQLFINTLKKRQNNTNKLKYYKKELRQLALSMNLNSAKYNQLFEKLNQPIIY